MNWDEINCRTDCKICSKGMHSCSKGSVTCLKRRKEYQTDKQKLGFFRRE